MSNTRAPEVERQARQKERGLWNFLTWSFFLSQVIADGQYTGAAAASSAHAEETSEHSGGARQSSSQPPMGAMPGSGLEGRESGTGVHPTTAVAAPHVALPEVNGDAISKFAPAEVADDNDPRQLGAPGASAGGQIASAGDQEAGNTPPSMSDDPSSGGGGIGADPTDAIPPIGSGVVDLIDDLLEPPLSVIGEIIGDLPDALPETIDDLMSTLDGLTKLIGASTAQVPEVLNTVLSKTVPDIAAPATELLKSVPTLLPTVIDDALPDLLDLGKQADGGLISDVLSAPGQILFKPSTIGGDLSLDLFSRDGKYTDYNLAVRGEQDTQTGTGASTKSSSTLLDKLLTPDATDASHPQGDSHSSPTLVHVIDDAGKTVSDWLNP
jgi:hypothetical protein